MQLNKNKYKCFKNKKHLHLLGVDVFLEYFNSYLSSSLPPEIKSADFDDTVEASFL